MCKTETNRDLIVFQQQMTLRKSTIQLNSKQTTNYPNQICQKGQHFGAKC